MRNFFRLMMDESGRKSFVEYFEKEGKSLANNLDSENFVYKFKNFFKNLFSTLPSFMKTVFHVLVLAAVIYSVRKFWQKFICGSFCLTRY